MNEVFDLPFIQGFRRLCNDGFNFGWHERNGGNLTYLLSDEEVDLIRPHFNDRAGAWIEMGVAAPSLAHRFIMATGSGRFMRNVWEYTDHAAGIIELNDKGSAWRIVWGFKEDGRPTSEIESHIMNLAVRCEADNFNTRVCYHMHCPHLIEMTYIVPLEDRVFSRILWQMMTECVVVFPQGVGVVPWMVPGGSEIAKATSEKMKHFSAAVWAQHGLFATGASFDETFGLAHTIEKAAQLYIETRSANGGSDKFLNIITDELLVQTCKDFGVEINPNFI